MTPLEVLSLAVGFPREFMEEHHVPCFRRNGVAPLVISAEIRGKIGREHPSKQGLLNMRHVQYFGLCCLLSLLSSSFLASLVVDEGINVIALECTLRALYSRVPVQDSFLPRVE